MDRSSVGHSGSSFGSIVSEDPLCPRKEAGGVGDHIQGCTLIITLLFLLINTVVCFELISQLKQPYPLPQQTLSESEFVYIKTFFFSPQTYLKHFCLIV